MKKVKKQKSRSRARAECDALFSKLIRERDRFCQKCGESSNLQCAHVFSRRYLGSRCDPLNAMALCRGCHVYFTHRPIEWEVWVTSVWGDKWYQNSKRRALEGPTPDWFEVLAELKATGLSPRSGEPPA